MRVGRTLAVVLMVLAMPPVSLAAPSQPAVVIEAPDGSVYTPRLTRSVSTDASGAETSTDFDGAGAPVIHAAAGGSLTFRFSFQPTDVKISARGSELTPAPAATIVWRIPAAGEYDVMLEVAGLDAASFRLSYLFRVSTESRETVVIRPYVSTPRGVSPLNSRRIVRLCRGDTVNVVLGYPAVRIRGTGFGGGPLRVVEVPSGTFSWKLRARQGGRARITAWDEAGRRHAYAFRYSVRRC
jgi:hypothetical protein